MSSPHERNIAPSGEDVNRVRPGMDSLTLATLIKPTPLSDNDIRTLTAIDGIDWERGSLDISRPSHQDFAARAAALGRPVFYGFGNFYALLARPEKASVMHVNLAKGRPVNQVGSVTTTREHFSDLFAWEKLPQGLEKERVLAIMDAFFDMGPFGFRGPAVDRIPEHLISQVPETQVRTTQLIAPGYDCPSNQMLEKVLSYAQTDHFFITSANISKNLTGQEEPAHYRMGPIQKEFGQMTGFVMLKHPDENRQIHRYAQHGYEPMSTSILGFTELRQDAAGRPALVVHRHGSLPLQQIATVLDTFDLGVVVGEQAKTRLPRRHYPEDNRNEQAIFHRPL